MDRETETSDLSTCCSSSRTRKVEVEPKPFTLRDCPLPSSPSLFPLFPVHKIKKLREGPSSGVQPIQKGGP